MQQSNASNFNILNLGGGAEFKQIVMSMLGSINTGEMVKVIEVEASGLNPVGFVSVKPLIYRTDADNNNVELGIIHNVPYFRLQGGVNAVIIDPEIGDIGFCGFCSRDISLFKRIREMAAQNTSRISDISDAFFFGGWSNKAPEQYIQFLESGINIKSTGDVNINGLTIKPDGTLVLKNGVIVDTHIHSQGNDSAGNSQVDTGVGHN